MPRPYRVLLALLAVPALAGAAPAPDPAAIIAAAKQASGGSAWDKPQGCTETGTHGDGAIAYTTRFSLRDYGMRVDSERDGNKRTMGFNGTMPWAAGPDGKVATRPDAAARIEAIVTNYLSINGFFFPKRFPATIRYLRTEAEPGRTFDVIEMSPAGGRAFEAWFDRATHLIGRVVDTSGTPPVRVEASDHRRIDGLTVAYRLDVYAPDGSLVDRGALTSFRCGPIDRAVFDPAG